jgi:hypothetical protein
MPAWVKATPEKFDGVIWLNLDRAFQMERRSTWTAIQMEGPSALLHYSVKETPEELLHQVRERWRY